MNNDRGKAEYVENYNKRQEVYERLQGLEQERRRVHTPEDLEAFERELRGYTGQLGAWLLELHLQASLECEEHQKKEEALIRSWPGRLRSDGYERVRIFTLGVFGSRSGPVTIVVPVIVGVGRGIKGCMAVWCY
jgi:hypothetical protein